MATASVNRNGADTVNPVNHHFDEEKAFYAALTPKRRIASALEMAQEISEHQEQVYFEPYKTYYLHTPQFEVGAAAILMQALTEASQEN